MNDMTLPAAVGAPFERGVRQQRADEARERPILFSAPMVRALLAGTKTQTRRVVKRASDDWSPVGPEWFSPTVVDRRGDEQPGRDVYGAGNEDGTEWIRCLYGAPGDRLWVRETWAETDTEDGTPVVAYRAGGSIPVGREYANGPDYLIADWHKEDFPPVDKWRPSIFMPRWASRLFLTLTSVRVELLNDISRGDAMAEGCPFPNMAIGADPRQWYADLWDEINGPGAWAANPWVWVLAFQQGPNLQPNVAIKRGPTA